MIRGVEEREQVPRPLESLAAQAESEDEGLDDDAAWKTEADSKIIQNVKKCGPIIALVGLAFVVLALLIIFATTPASPDESVAVACDVLVLGGGAAGLYSAVRLGESLQSGVCLLEASSTLGGRLDDAPAPAPSSGKFGMCALRVSSAQALAQCVAGRLGVRFQGAPGRLHLAYARGALYANASALAAQAFPLLADPAAADPLRASLDRLLQGPLRPQAGQYPDMLAYAQAALGAEGATYLATSLEFVSQFGHYNASNMLEWLEQVVAADAAEALYPVGGMEVFADQMAAQLRQRGVQVFTSELVLAVERDAASAAYAVTTSSGAGPRTYTAPKLINAIPPLSFSSVTGSVASALQQAGQFAQLQAVPAVTVAQWWPTRWWEDAAAVRSLGGAPGATLRLSSDAHCLSIALFPGNPSSVLQNVSRSVYDDGRCLPMWQALAKGPPAALEDEVQRELEALLPGASIPPPRQTIAHYEPQAWYFTAVGARYTNGEVASWAAAPPGLDGLCCAGDAYLPAASGWFDTALRSAEACLARQFALPPLCGES